MAPKAIAQDIALKKGEYFGKTRTEVFPYVPKTAKRLLECGCGEGLFGLQLKQALGAEVWGIEIDEAAGKKAAESLDRVLIGNLANEVPALPNAHFDCIVFNDVLEHLVDPFSVLTLAKDKLCEGGVVVCSIPNIRYFVAFRDYVFRKQWKYEEYGIWDKTHLRYFTRKSIVAMFEALGYELLNIDGINGITSWKFGVLNALTLGFLSDTRFMQYACVARPK